MSIPLSDTVQCEKPERLSAGRKKQQYVLSNTLGRHGSSYPVIRVNYGSTFCFDTKLSAVYSVNFSISLKLIQWEKEVPESLKFLQTWKIKRGTDTGDEKRRSGRTLFMYIYTCACTCRTASTCWQIIDLNE